LDSALHGFFVHYDFRILWIPTHGIKSNIEAKQQAVENESALSAAAKPSPVAKADAKATPEAKATSEAKGEVKGVLLCQERLFLEMRSLTCACFLG
jgi:hypothetical protein